MVNQTAEKTDSEPGLEKKELEHSESKISSTADISTEGLVRGIGFLRDVPVTISVEIGRCKMAIGEILALGPSSVIELDKPANEPLDIRVNGVLVARGEPVVVADRFGVRLTSLVEPKQLLKSFETT